MKCKNCENELCDKCDKCVFPNHHHDSSDPTWSRCTNPEVEDEVKKENKRRHNN